MISLEIKNKIIKRNQEFGIKTIFYHDNSSILGYSENNTIYLNEESSIDIEKVNEHELLHFFEDTNFFKKVKNEIIKIISSKIDIDKKRDEYLLSYHGVYGNDEIKNGILDTEIVIDYLTNNILELQNDKLDEKIRVLKEEILKQVRKEVIEKRYLNLSLKQNIANMKDLTKFEKLFLQNYIGLGKYKIPQGNNRIEQIRSDIKKELDRLYNLPFETFKINTDSKSLEREFEGELKALEARGEKYKADYFRENKKVELEELSYTYSTKLYEEYKHIVAFLKTANYENAFKVLMLNETLSKVYKKENNQTIIQKRKLNETIAGHMILNQDVLDIIYNKLDDYDNFADLYYTGLAIYNKIIAESSTVTLENVNTYGMGKWIKFEGKKTNKNTYLQNVEKLKTLVQDTPWCTKELAASQLEQGDFYIFVDNLGKPHIAIKLNGNTIDEVRGLLNGNLQELEEDYREVAISFLKNNENINGGKEWLEKEVWNKKLINWNKKINANLIKQEDIPLLIECLLKKDYKPHFGENSNLVELRNNLEKVKDKLAKYYKVSEDEICIGDYSYIKGKNHCPYVVITGNVNFSNSTDYDFSKLKIIFGNVNFRWTRIQELRSLESIGGDVDFEGAHIYNLGSLQNIGGNVSFNNSLIQNLNSLQSIGGHANFYGTEIEDLSSIKSIGGDAGFSHSQVRDLSSLQSIGGNASFSNSIVEKLNSLQSIGSGANFSNSKVRDLSSLQRIERAAFFQNSLVEDLSSLESIGGIASFVNTEIPNLKSLKSIWGKIEIESEKRITFDEFMELLKNKIKTR